MDRSPRAVHELHQSFAQFRFTDKGKDNNDAPANSRSYDGYDDWDNYEEYDDSDNDNDFDNAAPPPVASDRSTPQHLELQPRAPKSSFNPLQSHPVASTTAPVLDPRYRFSHPLRQQQELLRQQLAAQRQHEEALLQQEEALRRREQALRQQEEAFLQQQETLRQQQEALRRQHQDPLQRPILTSRQSNPLPRRHPSKLQSYRGASSRFHPRLRQRTSLETIASVATTPSLYDHFDTESPSDLSTLEDESPGPFAPASTPVPSHPPSLRSVSISSTRSSGTAARSVDTVETQPPRSLLHKFKSNSSKRSGSLSDQATDRLVIERNVSIDHSSKPSTCPSPVPTSSSGEPSSTGYPSSDIARSQSSSEWKASEHDISSLTAEELKKCKKKGINPALYAEMKAARKGKWMSPIAGNTFLS